MFEFLDCLLNGLGVLLYIAVLVAIIYILLATSIGNIILFILAIAIVGKIAKEM